MTNLLKHAAHNKQVDNALRIAIEAAWDKLDDKPVQKPVACRFCHSEKGCWAWQCYKCGEIDDVQQPAAQPEQEPVAHTKYDRGCYKCRSQFCPGNCIYTAAPLPVQTQRQWVGLKDEDMNDPRTQNFDFIYGARWAESKLKERNNG